MTSQDRQGVEHEGTCERFRSCPFCGKQDTLSVITPADLRDDEPDVHSYSFAVNCNGSAPDGPGGCGATGGFAITVEKAINKWNRRGASEESTP